MNFKELIENLNLSDGAIARKLVDLYGVKVDRVTILKIRRGDTTEPRYSLGKALIDLAAVHEQDKNGTNSHTR